MEEFDRSTVVTMDLGSVEYAAEDAAVSIRALIDALTEAESDGATHVVGLSGNYRGAKYVRLHPWVEWLEED